MTGNSRAEREARFCDLLISYGAALERLSRAYCTNPFDQQDLFQEIALAIWSAVERFRGESSERTCVYRIAHNVALTFQSKGRRRETREQPLVDQRAPCQPDEDQRLELLEMVRRLPQIDRQIMLLHLEGLTGPEIAEVTGLTSTNIGVRLMRARQRMIDEIKPKEMKR